MSLISHGRNGVALQIASGDGDGSRIGGSRSAVPLLDESCQLLDSGEVDPGMTMLVSGLNELRRAAGPEEWRIILQPQVLSHRVGSLVWQDPFTVHSYNKPRGYAGDAALLDYIYGHAPPPPQTSDLGREIFKFTCNSHAPRSVRARAGVLADLIDRTADEFASPRILSIACGHLRELHGSKAASAGKIGEFLALDQDSQSLDHIAAEYSGQGIKPVLGSIRSILAEKSTFDRLNLVYAAGLYDYLSDRVAERLTRLMFDMLAPGGRLLVANFTPRLNDIGYMETFMAWDLIYRDPDQMTSLARDIVSSEWHSHRLFWDEHESIVFLEITKRRRASVSLAFGPGIASAAVPGLNAFRIGAAMRAEKSSANGDGHPVNGESLKRHPERVKPDSEPDPGGRSHR